MIGNSILNKAKYSDNTDEWYTDYDTVENELKNYKKQFENKIILCNSDNPLESAFAMYFLKNFNRLKIRKLICTSLSEVKKYEKDNDCQRLHTGKLMIVDKFPIFDDNQDIIDYIKKKNLITKLEGNGDFLNEEGCLYLKMSDIVVTNPPFSKFTDLFLLIMKYKKKFLLIGNQNAIMYKEIFPYIKNNLVWSGYHFGDMSFKVPKDTIPRKTRFWIDENGQKWRSLGNAMWFTNLEKTAGKRELLLSYQYKDINYPKYDDFNAIHIKKVAEIPYNYKGIMGVPLTYIKYHNPERFEIIGEANHGSDNKYDLFKPRIEGKEVYKRLLIQRKSTGKGV